MPTKPAIICAIGNLGQRVFLTEVGKSGWKGSPSMGTAQRYSSFRKAVNASKKLAAMPNQPGGTPWAYMAVELT